MRDCNRLFREVASRLNGFAKVVAKSFGVPFTKFLSAFWSGMLANQSVLLTEIARASGSNVLITKQVERFCNHLSSQNCEDLLPQYHLYIKNEINDKTIYCIDNTDIVKFYGEKFEYLGKVLDGSTGEIEKGFEGVNVVALSQKHKQPIPLYSRLFSNVDPNYVSNNLETEKALDCIRQSFGSGGIKVFDRGYDDSKLMRYLINHSEKFIIRCKKNRDVYFNNKKINITDIVKEPAHAIQNLFTKGKKALTLIFKKYSVIVAEMELNLIVVTGFGKDPMFLLTNMEDAKELETTVVRVYLLRWKVEEKFRFEKDVFDLEDFRVRNMQAMRNLVLLTSMLCGFIAVICEHQMSKLFKRLLNYSQTIHKKPKKNHLYFYSIARAIERLFCKYFSSA